jgi:hypothetical protein
MGMYQQLAGQQLKNGSKLHVIVLPASAQSDIVPQIQRLACTWVLQLWYHAYADDYAFSQTQPRGAQVDSLLFTLWNGATQKVIGSGSGFLSLREPPLTPYASFRTQILKTLNRLRNPPP